MSDLSPLVGMPARTTIVINDGRVLVKQGEIITQGVIAAAKRFGRMNELMMSANTDASQAMTIQPISEYVEIGEEEPLGIHPE
jgi:hypothetical protein